MYVVNRLLDAVRNGLSPDPSVMQVRWLFLRGLAVVTLLAFFSLHLQIIGLIGSGNRVDATEPVRRGAPSLRKGTHLPLRVFRVEIALGGGAMVETNRSTTLFSTENPSQWTSRKSSVNHHMELDQPAYIPIRKGRSSRV